MHTLIVLILIAALVLASAFLGYALCLLYFTGVFK
jgi:hypothetical protein